MYVVVLGAAAGGGFPQWNANHEACCRVRSGDPLAPPATQASIAVSADNQRWILINASPDLRGQIERTEVLWPRSGLRSSPIKAVVLTNADVDAVAGLLNLREGTSFSLFAHSNVHNTLSENPIFDVLNRSIVDRKPVVTGRPFEPSDDEDRSLGLVIEAFLVPGKIPLYHEGRSAEEIDTAAEDGDTLGLEIRLGSKRLVYLANCACVTDRIKRRLQGADLLFMDGTLWHDNEMIDLGVGQKTGSRMGHISMSGENGAIARLADLTIGRRVFLHINNTNPALLGDSAERRELTAQGWHVAHDGMELQL